MKNLGEFITIGTRIGDNISELTRDLLQLGDLVKRTVLDSAIPDERK